MQVNKVRELLECDGVQSRKPPVVYPGELRMALEVDEADHGRERVTHSESIGAKNARIAELVADLRNAQAEAAKARELPPLPETVRAHLRNCRAAGPALKWTRDLIAWEDTHYPKPRTRAELDADTLAEIAELRIISVDHQLALAAIAKRLRESKIP
jgi:hypothetical protein